MSGVLVDPTVFASGVTQVDLIDDFAGSIDAWNIWLTAQPRAGTYQLNIPAGDYVFLGGGAESDFLALGNRHVLVTGDTAANTSVQIGGIAGPAPFSLGENADSPSHNPQPRFVTALAGATTITLTVPAKASLFPLNVYACISAYCTQAHGYPPNLHWFEFRKIIDRNTLTGVLTLDEGLHYDYLDDFPDFRTIDPTFQPDRGGAATAFPWVNLDHRFASWVKTTPDATNNVWDMDLEIRNLSLTGETPGTQFYGSCKSILLEDCIIEGSLSPNSAISFTMRNCTMLNNQMEVDKQIETLTFEDCHMRSILCQSSSTNNMYLTDCVIDQDVVALVKNVTFTRTTMGSFIRWYPLYFGITDTLTLIDSTFTSWPIAGGNVLDPTVVTFEAGGIMRITRDGWENAGFGAAMGYTIPGATFLVIDNASPYNSRTGFKVLGLECEGGDIHAGDVLVSTTIPDAYYATLFSTDWRAFIYGPQLTISGCDGCRQARSLSRGHPAGGRPFVYSNSGVFDGTNALGSPADNDTPLCDGSEIHGYFESITIEVTQAYTGAVALSPQSMYLFGNFANAAWLVLEDGTRTNWYCIIDLTQVGTRVVTPGSITGALGNDSFTGASVTTGQLAWLSCADPDLYIRTPAGNRRDFNAVPLGERPNVRVTIVVDPMFD